MKTKLYNTVHFALENARVPCIDRFQRIMELDKENFNYDLHYPDLAEHRTDRFALWTYFFQSGEVLS